MSVRQIDYKKQNPSNESDKWKILKITKENQAMLKRLDNTNSVYSFKKFHNDFEKTKTYRRNICEFPCIEYNLVTTKSVFDNNFEKLKSTAKPSENQLMKSNLNTGIVESNKHRKTTYSFFDNPINKNQKVLFIANKSFNNLFDCASKFYLESNMYLNFFRIRLVLSITPLNSRENVYFIIFNEVVGNNN